MGQKGSPRSPQGEAGFAPILIVIILAGVILFAPLPRYQQVMCNEMDPPTCYPAGWRLGSSLWDELTGKTTQTTQQSIPVPPPSLKPSGNGETADWKTYQNENVTFRYPSKWIQKPNLSRGSGFTQEFEDLENKFSFTFSSNGNYNQITGKPYATIDDFINMSYRVKTVTIDGQEGRQPLPRAGGENVNSVVFFSKDSKFIYTLELKTGSTALDTPETDIKEGQKLFNQILSTFRFN